MADNSQDLDSYDEPARYWLNHIEGALKDHDKFYERGKAVLDRYLNEGASGASKDTHGHKMNVLWSNVQTTTPALYAKTPNPKVSRRYRDKDPVGKWTAIVLERANGFHFDVYDCDHNIRNCVQDYLLPGRGQVWLSYEPTFTQGPPGPDGKPTEQIAWEYAKDEHLNWKDFLHSPARTWDEVWWVAKRGYMTKEEVKAFPHFEKGVHKELTFTEEREGDSTDAGKGERAKKAAIWEIWCKPKNEVVYVSKNCPKLLGKRPPPIKFEGFFPCPRPLTTTTTTESIIPTPDFCQYQNQADEIDRMSQRINLLTDALRVAGFYDAGLDGDAPGSGSIANLFQSTGENTMIPLANWAMFAQGGGFDGAVSFFPLKDVIDTLTQCYVARDQAKAVMYEITGISDIVRGASDAQETATAQQIKSQWGSLRIRDRQAEVQRFVRDIMRLKSEIIAEHFQLETLKAMSNCPLLMQQEKQQLTQRKQMAQQAMQFAQQNPQAAQQAVQANPQLAQLAQPLSLEDEQRLREPTWEEVYQLLKDQRLRAYRIDIETDSTINPDEVAEKQQRTEFVAAATSFMQAWGPMVMQYPKAAPLAGELLTFAARAFKQSDQLETEIEAFVDGMNQMALAGPQAQPKDPKVAAEEKKAALEQQKMQAEQQRDQQKAQREDAQFAQKAQAEQQRLQQDMAFENEKRQFERERMAYERQAMQEQAQFSQVERADRYREIELKQQGETEKARAQRPSEQELTAVMAPLVQFLEQMAQANAQMQQAVAESVTLLAQAAQQMAAAASAPKELVVKRDGQGKISGGTAAPRLN